MIASRYARDVQPGDIIVVRVGRTTHRGAVAANTVAPGPRQEIKVNCSECSRIEHLNWAPTALITVERTAS